MLGNYGVVRLQRPAFLDEALRERKTNPRRFRVARIVESYLDRAERPYVHLLDGGFSDTIGLRVPLENVLLVGGPVARTAQLEMVPVEHVAVIVVNAEVHPPAKCDLAATSPGLAAVLGSVTETQIYGYNFETIELMRESLAAWARQLPSRPDGSPVRTSLVTIGFEDIEDGKEREYFQSVPTSFSLSDETVNRLIAIARRLLRESPEFGALVRQLSGEADRPEP